MSAFSAASWSPSSAPPRCWRCSSWFPEDASKARRPLTHGGPDFLFLLHWLGSGASLAPLDQKRRQCGQGKDCDWENERRLHRVDVCVHEDRVRDLLDLRGHSRWDVGRQPRSTLARTDLEPLRRNIRERGHELIAKRRRQRTRVADGLIVQRGGKLVLQKRADHGAADGGAQLADGVEYA